MAVSSSYLIDLNNFLQSNNVKLIVWPIRTDAEISSLLEQNNISYISPEITYDRSLVYEYDSHPNEKGHEIISSALYPKIERKLAEFNVIK